MVSTVAVRVDDDEFAVGPCLVNLPRGVEGAADVEPSVDERSRDACEAAGVLDDLVWAEPGVVAPAVSHLSGETEAEAWIGIAKVRSDLWRGGHVCVLPAAPRTCGLFPHRGVGIHQEPVVGINQTLVAKVSRDVIAELPPFSREEPSGVHGQPVNVVSCAGTHRRENNGNDP